MDAPQNLFLVRFGQREDPRLDPKKRHGLIDIIAINRCAVIAGADAEGLDFMLERPGPSLEYLRACLRSRAGFSDHVKE